MNSVLMETIELKSLWKLVKAGEKRPLSAGDRRMPRRARSVHQETRLGASRGG